jgi:hypothetical protein
LATPEQAEFERNAEYYATLAEHYDLEGVMWLPIASNSTPRFRIEFSTAKFAETVSGFRQKRTASRNCE